MPASSSTSQLVRTILSTGLILAVCSGFLLNTADQPQRLSQSPSKITPALQTEMETAAPGAGLPVIVTLADQPDPQALSVQGLGATRQERVIRGLRSFAASAQHSLRAYLDSTLSPAAVTYFWIFNGLSLRATPELISTLAARDDVASIRPEMVITLPEETVPQLAAPPAANIDYTHAPALWALGFRGQGVVVASLDTGVDVNHPDLVGRWRGGSNSWYDATTGSTSGQPTDITKTVPGQGHGTGTMGIMVGGSASGFAIGMAPDAQWIAAKIFDASGSATETYIHRAFEWVLDPDGNPATADAPQVVNNSWVAGSTCDTANVFGPDLQSLVTGGILPVFSAGNYGGSGASSGRYPATRPEALAVGSIDVSGQIAPSSSRGPNTCGVSNYYASDLYPALVAPGVNVTTSYLNGAYITESGTSFSAPTVSGAIALLLSAFPHLTPAQQAHALVTTSSDLGLIGPDNTYGYGSLDVLAAYQSLLPDPRPYKIYFLPIYNASAPVFSTGP
jgi:subtilisin family serine protease